MIDYLLQLNPYLAVAAISMLPIVEVRGAVPLAIAGYSIHPLLAIVISVVASLVPVVVLLLILEPLTRWLRTLHPVIDRFFTWLFRRTYRKHTVRFERWGSLALMLFVAIPLPFTGAWTGTLLAYLFGIKFKHAITFIAIGCLIAAIIMATISVGGIAILTL